MNQNMLAKPLASMLTERKAESSIARRLSNERNLLSRMKDQADSMSISSKTTLDDTKTMTMTRLEEPIPLDVDFNRLASKLKQFNIIDEDVNFLTHIMDDTLKGKIEAPLSLINLALLTCDAPILELKEQVLFKQFGFPDCKLCGWIEEPYIHEQLLENRLEVLQNLLDLPFINKQTELFCWPPEKFEVFANICTEAADDIAMMEFLYLHTRTALMSLGSNPRNYFDDVEGVLRPHIESYKKAQRVFSTSLSRMMDSGQLDSQAVAQEVLRMLHPDDWKQMLCHLQREVPSREPAKPRDEILDRVKALLSVREVDTGIPVDEDDAEYFTEKFRGMMESEEGFSKGMQTILIALRLSENGFSRDDAAFLATENPGEFLIELHEDADGTLEFFDLDHGQLLEIFRLTGENHASAFVDSLKSYSKWMDIMPGNFSSEDKMLLSAFLSIYAPNPPDNRRDLADFLGEREDELIEGAENFERKKAFQILDLAVFYQDYSKRFLSSAPLSPSTDSQDQEESGPAKPPRPHSTLVFSKEVANAIKADDLKVEDVKMALVYGLKLFTSMRAVGGRYTPVQFLRRKCEVVFSENGTDVHQRRADVEKFLTKHGVISLYGSPRQGGERVRLNTKASDSYSTEPTEIGQSILDSTLKWCYEFRKN
jgi:hypothetical protein